MREYRDCHALTWAHPAGLAFADAWDRLTVGQRRQVAPGGIFPLFDAQKAGPPCRKHAAIVAPYEDDEGDRAWNDRQDQRAR